jgi:hypothetical protein
MSIYLWLPSVWDAGRVSHLDIEEPNKSLHEDVARATMTTKVTDGYAQRPTPTGTQERITVVYYHHPHHHTAALALLASYVCPIQVTVKICL